MPEHDPIDPRSPDAEQRLRERLSALKAEARAVDPDNFWLLASDLTDLGYVRLGLDVAHRLTADGRSADQITVLDWGGGPGFLVPARGVRLSHELRFYDLAYDYPSYKLVLERLAGDVSFIDDQVALPFDDGSFDAVISFGVLEHVPDPSRHRSSNFTAYSSRAGGCSCTTSRTATATSRASRREWAADTRVSSDTGRIGDTAGRAPLHRGKRLLPLSVAE